MSLISAVKSLNIKEIELCECRYYKTHGTCWHIDPSLKKSVKSKPVGINGDKTLDKFIQSPTPKTQPSCETTSHKFVGSSPKDKALKFLESLRSQGIPSELKEEDSRFYVFFQKQGWKGNTYSYVKIFS
jgi:hypothetical protein